MSKNRNRNSVTFSTESKVSTETEKLAEIQSTGTVVNEEVLDEIEPATVPAEEVPPMVVNPEVAVTPEPFKLPDPIIDTSDIKIEPKFFQMGDSVRGNENTKIEPKFFQVGSFVRIKENTTKTATGATLPSFALRNTYRVSKILDDRILIQAGFYQTAVTMNDLVFVD